MKKHLVVLSGAGMSAESGISTFRDSDGLWEKHRIEEVATPEGWHRNPQLVLDFYNARRKKLKEVEPNVAHNILAELEKSFQVSVITQNVDDLHERAGSKNIIHLHGELNKVRSEKNESLQYQWTEDLHIGDKAEDGAQLRPHIVWFGEMVPMLEPAIELIKTADIILIIGTSMQVYPAAGLYTYAPYQSTIYSINPDESTIPNGVISIKATATEGMKQFQKLILTE